MSDPMSGWFTDDFTGIEYSEGRGGDLVPKQWAKVTFEEVTYGPSKGKKTPEFNCRLRLDATYALTPKRTFFHRFYLTPKTQAQVDGITRAAGLGRFQKRFGDPTGDKDTRQQYEGAEFETAAKALAVALKGRSVIGMVDVEVATEEKYSDKNRLANHYVANDENLAAILAGSFDTDNIQVKQRKDASGRKTSYLAAKGSGGASSAQPARVREVI